MDEWRFLPAAEISDDPEVARLWAEVLSAAELGTGSIMEALAEEEWQERRRRLLDRLKPSDSPLLWTVARDESTWLRVQLEEYYHNSFHLISPDERERLVGLLSRLCATSPTIDGYERLAEWHFIGGHREEAAEAYLSARRIAGGEWYWRFFPGHVVDGATEELLYLVGDREARLRAYPPEVAEVLGHRLRNLEADPDTESHLLERAVRRRDLPTDAYERAARRWSANERIYPPFPGSEKDRSVTSAWALLRVGKDQEALDRLVASEAWRRSPDLAAPLDVEVDSQIEKWNRDMVKALTEMRDSDFAKARLDLLSVMAMAEFRLGRLREARARLDLARRHRDFLVQIDSRMRETRPSSPRDDAIEIESFLEAERLIGPPELPDDPFAPE
ncbi:hypothetical protein [Paludisphaera sp.]|uniref:hypothetical protein n=1 Tax=Paludisphaera sp. TaxID=2017432 RepID=UPI00301B935A